MTVQGRAADFEKRAIRFLNDLGFSDVNGGPNFSVGNEQIDAVAGYGSELLIIECKYQTRRGQKSLRGPIRELNGRLSSIRKSIKRDPVYSKYKKIRLIIISKNVEVSEGDVKYAQEKGVTLMTDVHLNYYEDLAKSIGEYAKFDLLGELGISPPADELIRVPAVKISIGKHKAYYFSISAKKLLEFSYVARREVGKEQFYQRIVNGSRLGKIARFIDEEKGFFPNNVVVSINEKPSVFTYTGTKAHLPFPYDQSGTSFPIDTEPVLLQFPKKYRACWIIDGQHRLFTFSKTKRDQPLIVVAFDRLTLSEQTKLFIEINDEQKPVSPDLLWDLHGELRQDSEEGIISNAVKRLDTIVPFYRKFSIPSKGPKEKGALKFSGLCIAIRNVGLAKPKPSYLTRKNPLHHNDSSQTTSRLYKALQNYFSLLSNGLDEDIRDQVLFSNGGLSVFVYLYAKLLSRDGSLPGDDYLRKVVSSINSFFEGRPIDDFVRGLTSESNRSGATNEVASFVARQTGDDKLLHKVDDPAIKKDLISFESELRRFLKSFLQERGESLDSYVSAEARAEAKKRFRSKKGSDRRNQIDEFYGLSELKAVIFSERGWSKLKNIFVRPGCFDTRNEFYALLDRVVSSRNMVAHQATMHDIHPEDEKLTKTVLRRLKRCIS